MLPTADMESVSMLHPKELEAIRTSDYKEETCFYNLCDKTTICCGKVPWGKFKNRTHALFCSVFGLMCTALLLAVIFPLVIYRLVDDGIDEQVVMDSASNPNFDSWQTNAQGSGFDDVKITYSLYLFDLQNAPDVLKGALPLVNEVGPYVYDEYFNKFDIQWFDGGDTVAYNQQKYYIFNQDKSGPGLTEQDSITLPYPSVIGFEYLLDSLDPSVNAMLDAMMEQRLIGHAQNVTNTIDLLYAAVDGSTLPTVEKRNLEKQLAQANATQKAIFADLENLVATSDTGDILLKSLLCAIPSGISPFFQQTPSKAWFGWLNDPLMLEVQQLINEISAKTGKVIPWTSAIPGAATNYTSIADARRRRNVDTYKTGQQNLNQVGQYVRYQNMTQIHTCVSSTKASNPWVEGSEFPACPFFQHDWTEAQAAEHGYALPFATDYANGIRGTDATMFGRPLRTDKVQIYISDIYRSAYLGEVGEMDWEGITLKVVALQSKDLLNATSNPDNAQYYAFGYNGVENATQASGLPVYISFPHFLDADVELQRSVKGLHPNADIHSTWLGIEPQTGLLAKAHKRLQVNYFMEKYALPTISNQSVAEAQSLCASLQDVVTKVDPFTNATLPDISCNLTVITPLFTCLSIPSDWQLKDKLYMPYGWVSEDMDLPDSSAESLNDDLFSMDTVADGARFWLLVIAGGCFCVLVIMLVQMYQAAARTPQLAKWNAAAAAQSSAPVDPEKAGMSSAQPLLFESF